MWEGNKIDKVKYREMCFFECFFLGFFVGNVLWLRLLFVSVYLVYFRK